MLWEVRRMPVMDRKMKGLVRNKGQTWKKTFIET